MFYCLRVDFSRGQVERVWRYCGELVEDLLNLEQEGKILTSEPGATGYFLKGQRSIMPRLGLWVEDAWVCSVTLTAGGNYGTCRMLSLWASDGGQDWSAALQICLSSELC